MKRPLGSNWSNRAIILLCAAAAALPLAIRGNSCGHDFNFHLQSWMSVAQQWHQGLFYPHWLAAANFGAGEPRLVFYPPISWMLGALLGILLPWAATPFAFTFIVLAASGLSMSRLTRDWMPPHTAPHASTIAACAYILNPYTLFVAYERTAYGELAAAIWLPLIILYALRNQTNNCHPERSRETAQSKDLWFQQSSTSAIVPLALTIAAIWLTNAPAAVMACYLLAMIALWLAITRRTWQPILQSAVAVVLGLGLSAFYLVPAAYERRWVDIARAIGPDMRVEDSFLFAHSGGDFHDQVLRTASQIFVTMTVTIAVAVAIAWQRKAAPRLLLPLSVTAAVTFLLQLPWSNPIWLHAPELKFLQFPWRWALVLSIVWAISIAAATFSSSPAPTRKPLKAAGLVLIAIAGVAAGARLFRQPCDEYDAVSAQLAVFNSGNGFEGTDEYTTLGADNSEIEQELPPVRVVQQPGDELIDSGTFKISTDANPTYDPTDHVYAKGQLPAQVKIDRWQAEKKSITITSPAPGYALLRLMDYPAWQVFVNGVKLSTRPHRDDGLMAIPIVSGRTHLEITYAATPDAIWGRSISGTSLVILLAIGVYGRKRSAVGYHGTNAS